MIKRRRSKEKVRIRIYSRNSPVNNISHIRSSKYIPKRKNSQMDQDEKLFAIKNIRHKNFMDA